MRALSLRLLAGVGALALCASLARADTPAINVGTVGTYPPLTANGFNYYQPPGGYTFSWDFTANSPIQVTQLGYYNSALAGTPNNTDDGFGSHLVTLVDTTTNATLASTTVTATSTASGVFNYGTIAPVTLNTSDTYQISGTMTDQYYLVGLNQSAAPAAAQINYQFQPDLDIFGTNGPSGTYNDFGPNFLFASSCTENVAGRNVIALTGDKCTAAGAYNPTTSNVALPFPYNGVGLLADGGTITSSTPVTITTSNPNGGGGSYGVWAVGSGSQIFGGQTTITTVGANSHGVFASGGGQITSNGVLSVNTSGDGAIGVYASGAGSSITAALGTISTTGANAVGAQADAGGSVSLTGGAVTTSGEAAHAVFSTGAGSKINLFGAQSFTTGGDGAIGIYAAAGGVVTAPGAVSIKTSGTNALSTGLSSFGVNADGPGSSVTLGATTINTSGAGAVGLLASNRVATSDNAEAVRSAASVQATATGSVIVVNGALTVTTEAAFAYDAYASGAGSRIALNGATTLNVGAGAFGLYATGGGVITTGSGLTINAGAAGFGGGVEADAGSSITLGGASSSLHLTGTNLVGLFTTGTGAIAVQGALSLDAGANRGIVAQGGTINLNGSATVTTSGANALGVSATGGGVINAAPGLAVTTTGAGATAAYATGTGSTITAYQINLTTSGASSFGAQAADGGSLSLLGGAISTSGDGAAGLLVNDAGSTAMASGVTITTKGGIDAATNSYANGVYNGPGGEGASGGKLTLNNVTVSAAGFESAGVTTSTGGTTTITGGSFSTSGENAAAMNLTNSGQLQISGATLSTSGLGSPGLVINGSGGVVAASNLTITTTGQISTSTGSHADGIYNGTFGAVTGGGLMTVTDTTVKTTGDQAYGVSVGSGGTTTFLGGAVTTQGQQSNAARAANGGSLTIGLDAAGKGASLMTTGLGAYAVLASGGGLISLNGLTASGSTGDGSGGLGVNGAGSEIDVANSSVTTTGGYDPVTGLHAYGAANTPYGSFATGGVLKLTNSTLTTFGDSMYGVYTGASSTTTITGGTVETFGAGAHALVANGAGAMVTANGVALNTFGANAFGVYVANGGTLTLGGGAAITTTSAGASGIDVTGAGSTATLAGAVSISVGAGALGLSVDNGGAIVSNGALTINSIGTAITVQGGPSPGSISFGGPLTITTSSPTAPAILLTGDNASFNGGAGGTINAAGQAVALMNGVNQSATFVNYTINNVSGDLFFADPTTATLNFTNTTANAGSGNLVDATAGSAITVNASNSALTGAVATDATSTTNFNLTNSSSLMLTANSTITNLNLANSTLSFSSPAGGVFKTLTVTNFVGTNGAVTLNAALGAGQSDKIVINGGAATGATALSIRSIGAAGPTTGAGVPVVVATNGGTIAPGAFALAAPLVVNGYLYTLQEQGAGDFLVSNTTQTQAQASSSIAALSQSRETQAVTARVLGSILTGATEQINCSSCSSGFASFGSFALGMHGRWTLSPSLALLAGASYDSYSGRGVTVNNSMQAAVALRYDAVSLGRYRPFVEGGVTLQPWASVTYNRSYASALGGGVGTGTALARSAGVYGRLGYIWRLTRTDEAAVYTDLTRSWDYTSGYTESTSGGNPNAATVSPTLDTLNVWRTGGQFTHLFGEHIEGNLSGGFAQAFGAAFGTSAALGGFGAVTASAPTGFHWWELGGRVSYRFSKILTGDVFLLGTLGAQPVGEQLHGGVALRMAF